MVKNLLNSNLLFRITINFDWEVKKLEEFSWTKYSSWNYRYKRYTKEYQRV